MRARVFMMTLSAITLRKSFCNRSPDPASDKRTFSREWTVVLDIGRNVGPHVKSRIESYLSPWRHDVRSEDEEPLIDNILRSSIETDSNTAPLANGIILISLGDSATSQKVIDAAELSAAGPEGFVLKHYRQGTHRIICANGNTMDDSVPRSKVVLNGYGERNILYNTGAISGSYAVLELLGFGFFHPLRPVTPTSLSPPTKEISRIESPHWKYRGFHLHTQHPIELTDVLQGFDIEPQAVENKDEVFGSSGIFDYLMSTTLFNSLYGNSTAEGIEDHSIAVDDVSTSAEGTEVRDVANGESFESMLPEVESFFEWCAANKVNRVEWILLSDIHWKENSSNLRKNRLSLLVTIAHKFGVLVGVDVPIGLQQQHAWYMVTPWQTEMEQERLIKERCTWVAEAGFDFISTESGLSEFTNPGDELMLKLMDTFALHVNETLGLPASIKVHTSQGQKCNNFKNILSPAAYDSSHFTANSSSLDPMYSDLYFNFDSAVVKTKPTQLNFNFLPTYSVPSLGVMPHTVQAYGLDDFTAGVYGNHDFKEMKEYLFYEAKKGSRSVVYYGETAYWVSVDIDVPLFLPIYGERRLHDLRLIAKEEIKESFKIDGQMNFDSGWEWAYWLNDVITARAAWDPKLEMNTDAEAMNSLLRDIFDTVFGETFSIAISDWLTKLSSAQHSLLISGKFPDMTGNCTNEPTHDMLTGFAYISGSDTYFDLPRLLGIHLTQPDRVLPTQHNHPLYQCVLPLLRSIRSTFEMFQMELDFIIEEYGTDFTNINLLNEIRDSMKMLVMRAGQVESIYNSSAKDVDAETKEAHLAQSRDLIITAQHIVRERERHYRAPLSRIAFWRDLGPTSYRYGYLWSVHSLYNWWRDHGKAEGIGGPCYLNRMDPSQIAFGWGKSAFQALRMAIRTFFPINSDYFTNCLSPPKSEYQFPRDLYRYSRTFYSLLFGRART